MRPCYLALAVLFASLACAIADTPHMNFQPGDLVEIERGRIIPKATAYLEEPPVTVTVATAYCISPCHDRGPRWCALNLDIEVRQAETLGSQRVDSRSGCTAYDSPAIETWLTPTEIIQKDQHDIWFVLRHCDLA